MKEEILKLAIQSGLDSAMYDPHNGLNITDWMEELEAFYKAAYNKGLESAVNSCNKQRNKNGDARDCMNAVKALELK